MGWRFVHGQKFDPNFFKARGGRWVVAAFGALLMCSALVAAAQSGAGLQEAASDQEAGARFAFLASTPMLTLYGIVALVVLVMAAWVIYQRSDFPRPAYSDGDHRISRFEQLNAEMQGLTLRLQSGESRGYFKKIGTLGRVFLERIGIAGARGMSEEQLEKAVRSGQLSQEQITTLINLINRCREGAERESEKLAYTAAELLMELQNLVKQFEEASSSQSHS
jgi:hypothetical protein